MMRFKVPGVLFLFLLLLSGCKKEDPNTLVVVPAKLEIPKEGGVATFTIETDAGSWSIENQASGWLTLSVTKGTENKVVVTATVSTSCAEARVDTLIVTAGTATPAKIVVTQPPAEFLYSLTTNHSRLEFESKGSTSGLTITTDAPQWSIASDAGWIRFSQASGEKGTSSVDVIATKNTVDNVRSATITISAPSAPVVRVTVSQEGDIYPSYNSSPLAPDASGMSSTASELAAKIGLGWNIGNTLEAIGGETAWGNPLVTKELIDLVKKNGFNAIRIPCSWNQHMVDSTTAEIKEEWLDRVKEVVQYCVDDDLYVLLNIHWDGGWLENNCTEVKQDANNSKQRAFWEQIATHLRDFDEHLLFASANEPNVSSPEGMEVLNSYHQTFVDAVRSTGGRNSYRVLVVQGPSTDIEKTNSLMTTLPSDSAENRLMVEVHYYTPWNFCGLEEDASWGKMFYYWGKSYHSTTDTGRNANWGEESALDGYFKMMKNKFTSKGIPVILGEFGAVRRSSLTGDELTLHLASRAYFFKYVIKQSKANGILPFYWDAGNMGNNGSALFNRANNSVFDQQALDAILEGYNE